MPIDPTEPATNSGSDRRAFLTRSAAGGALVATVASTGLAGLGLGVAGAQDDAARLRTATQEYVLGAIPLELAAAVAYGSALTGDAVSGEIATTLRQFQRNHQDVAANLAGRVHADDAVPTADPAIVAQFSPPAGADEATVLTTLASLEEALSATHLGVIATFDDTSFAKVLSQFLAVEAQQAVTLGRAAGEPLDALTPPVATTDGALEAGGTASGSGSATEAGPDDAAGGQPDAGNATDSGNEVDTGGDDTDADAPGGSDNSGGADSSGDLDQN